TNTNTVQKLRSMFTLHAVGADSVQWLKTQLRQSEDHLRSWAVRFLAESDAQENELRALFADVAAADPSPTVRLEVASALQRMRPESREPVAAALLRHAEDNTDHYLPLMDWYAIEPVAAAYPDKAVHLAELSQIPLVREYIARRLAEEWTSRPSPVEQLLEWAVHSSALEQMDVLRGVAEALRGLHSAPKPRAWDSVQNAAL